MFHGINFYLGPVRAIAIHPTRALLATGGDDYKIKVWGRSYPDIMTALTIMTRRRYPTSEQTMLIYFTWAS